MRVLLIEDDSAVAQSIELMLKSESFNIYTTDLGEEGVDLGKLYDYDIILLDVNLPDMTGYDVLRQLRVSKIKTPVLFLSGTAEPEMDDRTKGLSLGADDYIVKPFHKGELVARISAIVQHSKRVADATELIPDFLDNVLRPLTTREIKEILSEAQLSIKATSLREILADLNFAGRIRRLGRDRYESPNSHSPKSRLSPPLIPAVSPAAIEPQWTNGKLSLLNLPLSTDLDGASLLAALEALREDLIELASDAMAVENCDHRPAEYLRRLADRIPGSMPSQMLLFRLGHANEVLNDLARTTDVEWPELLAARFRKLALQYERAVRQFPKWRAFVRNAAERKLTAEQIAEVPHIAETVIAELQTDDARIFVDQAIPDALGATQAPIVDWEAATNLGNEQLAEDVLESINNVLKRTVELSLALKNAGIDSLVSWTGTTVKKSIEEFGKEAQKSIVKEFGKLGKATGPALGRFLKRIARVTTLSGAVVGGGSLLLRRLFTLYPDTFGWLEPALRFLHLL